jgi:hypothetical protein
MSTNACGISLMTNNCTWTASVGSYSTNGTGTTASFTPTDCGSGSVSFHVAWSNACDGSTSAGDVSNNFNVLSLNIAGGGGIICSANANNLAMVGQHINLMAQTCGGTFSNFQWTVSGYAISNYTVGLGGSDNGSSTSVIIPESLTTYFPTTNSSVSFYWVDGGAKSLSCSAVCGGITCSTNVTITVTRPEVSMYYTKPTTWYGYASLLGGFSVGISLGNVINHANDLNYAVLINSPTEGDAEAVQTVSLFAINANNQVIGQQADGLVPYVSSPRISPGGTKSSFLPLDDGPRALVYFSSVTLAGSFDDYVMYQANISNTIYAPLGGDTIYVPLGKVRWQINGGYDGTTISPNYVSIIGPDNSTDFPIWTSIFVPTW